MIDFGINKKGRLRSKRTLLKLTVEYFEHSKDRFWWGVPDALLRNDKINIQERDKLEDHIEFTLKGGNYTTKEEVLLRFYQEIKHSKWIID